MSLMISQRKFHLFWSDIGGAGPKIESSDLSGSSRKILVNRNLILPISLSIDIPNRRLYWSDPKTSSIESINFDGGDRRLVKTFAFDESKPAYLDVFEDYVYYSTFEYQHRSSVRKISKFGNSSSTILLRDLPRHSDLILIHESKHKTSISSVCSNYASPSPKNSLCLPIDERTSTFVCSHGYKYNGEKFTCEENRNFSPACKMPCLNGGTCAVWNNNEKKSGNHESCVDCKNGFTGRYCQIDLCHNFCLNSGICKIYNETTKVGKNSGFDDAVFCNCPPQYDGPRCQRYKCTDYCKHGSCHVDRADFLPRCMCDDGYFGERCEQLSHESSSDPCWERCYNNGTCFVTPYGLPVCQCPPGFDGMRCQQCTALDCANGAVCLGDLGPNREICRCKMGFEGPLCEIDLCKDYCHHGICNRVGHSLKCDCPARFSGPRCSIDRCDGLCQNNGVCIEQPEAKNVACVCKRSFYGVFCEKRYTCDDYCQNNATCVEFNDTLTCKCPAGTSGDRCENLNCLPCRNGARCFKIDPTFSPQTHLNAIRLGDFFIQCRCPLGLTGQFCDRYDDANNHYCSSHLRCLNGLCHKPAGSSPRCLCRAGWRGLVCNLPTCYNYCLNDGYCLAINQIAICKCRGGYSGNRCERFDGNSTQIKATASRSRDNLSRPLLIVLLPLFVLLLLGGFIFYATFNKWRRLDIQFRHNRMHDDQILQNPSFLSGSEDDLSAFEGESTNFTNPLYDNVYNDTVVNTTNNEEHELLPNRDQTRNGHN
uniref:EGF-like domain-containing protein n=1 Tax=Romanomermis culicivorax TaxID=13658 RepID=A0A915K646_ROMCU